MTFNMVLISFLFFVNFTFAKETNDANNEQLMEINTQLLAINFTSCYINLNFLVGELNTQKSLSKVSITENLNQIAKLNGLLLLELKKIANLNFTDKVFLERLNNLNSLIESEIFQIKDFLNEKKKNEIKLKKINDIHNTLKREIEFYSKKKAK